MSKKMCKKGKDEEDTREAKYNCKKCGLMAAKEKHLCKPKKM
jgi:hypothetical protein